jgi:rRNA small subunit aminocarboxypropyltransferase
VTHDVVVIRHPRERISKCSLRRLHERPGFTFFKATKDFRFDATDHIELAVDAEPLGLADVGRPLLILDSTWRLLEELRAHVDGETVRRSIPNGIATAYPRISRNYPDPPGGLASIEALYVALKILGRDDPSILEGYHWRNEFLANIVAAGL